MVNFIRFGNIVLNEEMSYNLVSNYLVGVFFGCGVVVIGYSVFRFCVTNLKCFYLDLRVLIFIYFVILK